MYNELVAGKDRFRSDGNWAEIVSNFPPDMLESEKRFAHGYYRGQLHVKNGKGIKAERLFHSLDKIFGYLEFEEKRAEVLQMIDEKVKGESLHGKIMVTPLDSHQT